MNTELITKDYRGYTIRYIEEQDKWSTFDAEGIEVFSKDKLSEARMRIDKILDVEKKKPFKRFNALMNVYGELREVEISSVGESRSTYNQQVKVYYKHNGEKQTQNTNVSPNDTSSDFAFDTPKNREYYEKIKNLRIQIKALNNVINESLKSIEWISGEEFNKMLKERIGE